MKKARFVLIVLTFLAALASAVACGKTPSSSEPDYKITVSEELSYTIEVGSKPDYTKYFTVKDKNGLSVAVTEDMLDLSQADTTKVGSFDVRITVGSVTKLVTFTVVQPADKGPDEGKDEGPDGGKDEGPDISSVFEGYTDPSTWNFSVMVTETYQGETSEELYEYDGDKIVNMYTAETDDRIDYLAYDPATDTYTYYSDDGDQNSYTAYGDDTAEFEKYFSYSHIFYLEYLAEHAFTVIGEVYSAKDANAVGNDVLGEYEGSVWTTFNVTVQNGQIKKIYAVMDDGYTLRFEFSAYGNVHVTLPDATAGGGSGTGGTTPSGTMSKQNYDPSTFDKSTLQDKIQDSEDSIGLPSIGTYHALVIPVQFQGDTISQTQLDKLEIAFNGTEEQTGWESVKTYYQKASYGKLNLSFDIQEVYDADNNSGYYKQYQEKVTTEEGTYTIDGSEILLTEVLTYYKDKLDLTKYDSNEDGVIDAVYLIYSAPVNYARPDEGSEEEENSNFYWAYVTWYYGEETYDGKYPYYYLFAGFDFMDEKTQKDHSSGYDVVDGIKINAETYIHETGHLLGLDDYYDYSEGEGSNEGLGRADMMDYNIGDHGVYSKIMLGWLTPTIVNETKTVTIGCSATTGSAILIPLNFDNSYFCEYLLIDLYAATGLNATHSQDLYDGAQYGVRIYHVASSINTPYQEDGYVSFTDNNNSVSEHALIKLIEADGETRFSSSGGYAAEADLWQAGQTFSDVFPNYKNYENLLLNFDISIVSVSASQATITVTFAS